MYVQVSKLTGTEVASNAHRGHSLRPRIHGATRALAQISPPRHSRKLNHMLSGLPDWRALVLHAKHAWEESCYHAITKEVRTLRHQDHTCIVARISLVVLETPDAPDMLRSITDEAG